MGLPLVAQIAGNAEWLTVAEARAKQVLSADVGLFSTTMARVGLALIAVERRDVAAAEEQYAALVSVPGIMVFYVGTDRVLGLLSVTLGRLDQGINHFEDALAFCRRAGYWPDLAWTCRDYADSLLQRDSAGDRAKAITLLDEALAISTELGMRPLMERVTDRLEKAQSHPDKSPQYPDGLTQREVEVVRLVAGGKTNQEIGDELFISLRTVANHVTNILSKTGAANRAEAATYASRNGLL